MTAPVAAPLRKMPSYQLIRSEIEANILGGIWPPGSRIPAEHQLAGKFGCSRMTVSKAISALADAGLVLRRKRAGTIVARPRMHSAVLDIPDIQAEIIASGKAYRFMRLRESTAAPPTAADWPTTIAVLHLRGVHLANGVPFAFEQRWINLATVPMAADADFAASSPGSWLLDHVPWTAAENRISAITADAAIGRHLALPANAACLCVERRTWRGADHITFVRQIFPGDTYDLTARFGPPA